MTFRPDLAAAVLADEKTVTRRLLSDNPRSPWWRERCGYRVGQSVAICPGRGRHAIGRATITATARVVLGHLTDREAQAEGFSDRAAFERAWTAINGSYDPRALVWRISLRAEATP